MSGINFFEKGEGQPLILIHGFCEVSQMWNDFAEKLSSNFRVICPDLPGFGKSPLEHESITLEETAVILEEWMEKFNIHQPIVIGHSLGGYVTLALTELMGKNLKAIGLFHSTAFPDSEEKKDMRNRTVQFLKKNGVDKFATSFVPPLIPENKREELKEEVQKAIAQGKQSTLEGLIAYTYAMRDRRDRFEVLRNFTGSKLMIAGELDGAVPLEASRKHKEVITHYFELAETGHMGMIEQKAETIDILNDFCLSVI